MQATHGPGRGACRRSGSRWRHPARSAGRWQSATSSIRRLAGDALRVGVGGQTAQVKVTPDWHSSTGCGSVKRSFRSTIAASCCSTTPVWCRSAMSRSAIYSNSDFDPARIDGHLVLIGTTVEGLKDIRATPLAPVMPGVEIHAQILEQIIGKHLSHALLRCRRHREALSRRLRRRAAGVPLSAQCDCRHRGSGRRARRNHRRLVVAVRGERLPASIRSIQDLPPS